MAAVEKKIKHIPIKYFRINVRNDKKQLETAITELNYILSDYNDYLHNDDDYEFDKFSIIKAMKKVIELGDLSWMHKYFKLIIDWYYPCNMGTNRENLLNDMKVSLCKCNNCITEVYNNLKDDTYKWNLIKNLPNYKYPIITHFADYMFNKNPSDKITWNVIELLANQKIPKYQIILAHKYFQDNRIKDGKEQLSAVTDVKAICDYTRLRFSKNSADEIAFEIAEKYINYKDEFAIRLAQREYPKDCKKADNYIKPLLDRNVPEARNLYAKNHTDNIELVMEQLLLASLKGHKISINEYNTKMNELIDKIEPLQLKLVLKFMFKEICAKR